ncbi:spermidine synthase [Haloglycomyces albus]|uniref:spermidine synthase n=1 Tax=Haloglycomyces albus TaxID=526067 RepID=UPI00046D2306|nr:fused MFS/spermidine synthase [Haloglycomyces albus]
MSRTEYGYVVPWERMGKNMGVEFTSESDRPHVRRLVMDGVVQATLNIDDPTELDADYMRRMGYVIDEMAPSGLPLRAFHLGAGALTLARYLAATRPRSYQQAVEPSDELIELVRREAPLPKGVRVKIRRGDAREQAEKAPAACYDLIISDVYDRARIPGHLTTESAIGEFKRVLRPAGFFLANYCDGGGLNYLRRAVAGVVAQFTRVALISESAILRGRRFGNAVVIGSDGDIPVQSIRRRLAREAFPCQLLAGGELENFLGGARPLRDDDPRDSPPPPESSFAPRH